MNKIKKVLVALTMAVAVAAGTGSAVMAAGTPSPTTAPAVKTAISAKDLVKDTSYKKKTSFKLGATTNDGSKITYTSSNSNVTVDSTGKVTVPKNFVGTAKITMKANGVEKTVTVTIRPRVTKFTSLSAGSSTKATATWKTSKKVNGYQVQYAKNKAFTKSVKSKTVKGKSKSSKTLTKLKKGTYYVRVRTYNVVDGKKVYSKWTRIRTVKMG